MLRWRDVPFSPAHNDTAVIPPDNAVADWDNSANLNMHAIPTRQVIDATSEFLPFLSYQLRLAFLLLFMRPVFNVYSKAEWKHG